MKISIHILVLATSLALAEDQKKSKTEKRVVLELGLNAGHKEGYSHIRDDKGLSFDGFAHLSHGSQSFGSSLRLRQPQHVKAITLTKLPRPFALLVGNKISVPVKVSIPELVAKPIPKPYRGVFLEKETTIPVKEKNPVKIPLPIPQSQSRTEVTSKKVPLVNPYPLKVAPVSEYQHEDTVTEPYRYRGFTRRL